jgi:hypothetical protein
LVGDLHHMEWISPLDRVGQHFGEQHSVEAGEVQGSVDDLILSPLMPFASKHVVGASEVRSGTMSNSRDQL